MAHFLLIQRAPTSNLHNIALAKPQSVLLRRFQGFFPITELISIFGTSERRHTIQHTQEPCIVCDVPTPWNVQGACCTTSFLTRTLPHS